MRRSLPERVRRARRLPLPSVSPQRCGRNGSSPAHDVMTPATNNPDPAEVLALLRRWLARTSAAAALPWLEAEIERQRSDVDERKLLIALGIAGRKVGRADLVLTEIDRQDAAALRRGWQPAFWSADEAARAALLLATWSGGNPAFAGRV